MSASGESIRGSAPRAARLERWIRRSFRTAGIEIGGGRAWEPVVHDPRFYALAATRGSLGLGESYVDGLWDCADPAEFLRRLIVWRNARRGSWRLRLPALALDAAVALVNLQTRARATQVIDVHYDLPAHLYEYMLGSTMAYSCAYWRDSASLDEAQRHKLDLICRKLELRPGERLLDLGCGFGALSRHAAEHFGCEVVAVTLSRSQARFAERHCAGLPVTIHVCDYRDVDAYAAGRRFDKLASIAMFEAVGRRNLGTFMGVIDRLLADHGLWLLHTIGCEQEGSDPWLHRYIFPNGDLLGLGRIHRSMRHLFCAEDLHNFGLDYAPTLAAWRANFLRHWEAIRTADPQRFDERFRRRWTYYLDCCRASFLARNTHLWQLVMSKPARLASYQAVR